MFQILHNFMEFMELITVETDSSFRFTQENMLLARNRDETYIQQNVLNKCRDHATSAWDAGSQFQNDTNLDSSVSLSIYTSIYGLQNQASARIWFELSRWQWRCRGFLQCSCFHSLPWPQPMHELCQKQKHHCNRLKLPSLWPPLPLGPQVPPSQRHTSWLRCAMPCAMPL